MTSLSTLFEKPDGSPAGALTVQRANNHSYRWAVLDADGKPLQQGEHFWHQIPAHRRNLSSAMEWQLGCLEALAEDMARHLRTRQPHAGVWGMYDAPVHQWAGENHTVVRQATKDLGLVLQGLDR